MCLKQIIFCNSIIIHVSHEHQHSGRHTIKIKRTNDAQAPRATRTFTLLPILLHFYFFLTLAAGFVIGVIVASYGLSQGFAIHDLGIHEWQFRNSTSDLASTATNESLVLEPATSDLASTAWNETLGFGEVLYVSMPERTDRQDAMNLAASMSELKLRLINGPSRIIMQKWTLRPSELGCWRAHADAWRYVIDSNIETALIIEDDIDWDKNIHQVFQDLRFQMQNNTLRLVSPTDHERASAPYGLDWDVHIMGQCYDVAHPRRHDLVQVYDDPNVPSRTDTEGVFLRQMQSLGVRVTTLVRNGCSPRRTDRSAQWATQSPAGGAQRLLLNLSCRRERYGAIRLLPRFRVGGQKDSDNEPNPKLPVSGKGNIGGSSRNIKSSARVAMVNELAMDNWVEYTNKGTGSEKKAEKGKNGEGKPANGSKGS
ncbi:hypothetical protein V1506DRAFT_554581 [Lipomyces tetrasporus]